VSKVFGRKASVIEQSSKKKKKKGGARHNGSASAVACPRDFFACSIHIVQTCGHDLFSGIDLFGSIDRVRQSVATPKMKLV